MSPIPQAHNAWVIGKNINNMSYRNTVLNLKAFMIEKLKYFQLNSFGQSSG
jgi:hypothetical protein